MSQPAIRIDNLGKMYRIGRERPRAESRLGRVGQAMLSPFEWLTTQMRKPSEDEILWAMRNISFEVKRGEVVGIIGRNGAGKSTLLKVLSRITEPTEGQAEIRGRVGALLEIGTGMSPELTGRENIFVNGCILGMSRREVLDKFDEIVEFSGIRKFIDTPVKRYSSGMRVRLGFAIAAHLEPEILIVDEVLAVGDAEFQEKCLGKMHNIAGHGRTVLFVSHNMQAIEQLCSRAILLRDGRVAMDGDDPRAVVDAYLHLHQSKQQEGALWRNPGDRFSNKYFTPLSLGIVGADGNPVNTPFRNNDEMTVRIEGDVREIDRNTHIGFLLTDERENTIMVSTYTDEASEHWPKLREGRNVLQTRLPKRLLNEGKYRLHLDIQHRPSSRGKGKKVIVDGQYGEVAVQFSIVGGLSDSLLWQHKRPGVVAPVLRWESGSPDHGSPGQ